MSQGVLALKVAVCGSDAGPSPCSSQAAMQGFVSGGPLVTGPGWQHGGPDQQAILQDTIEANMPEDAVEHHEVATLQTTESKDAIAEDSRITIRKLSERLANTGINAARTRMLDKHDEDYAENYRDTF